MVKDLLPRSIRDPTPFCCLQSLRLPTWWLVLVSLNKRLLAVHDSLLHQSKQCHFGCLTKHRQVFLFVGLHWNDHWGCSRLSFPGNIQWRGSCCLQCVVLCCMFPTLFFSFCILGVIVIMKAGWMPPCTGVTEEATSAIFHTVTLFQTAITQFIVLNICPSVSQWPFYKVWALVEWTDVLA